MKTYCFYNKENSDAIAAAALVNLYEKGKVEFISSASPDPELFHDCKIYILGVEISKSTLEALHMINRIYWFDSPVDTNNALSFIPGFRHANPDISIWWLTSIYLYPNTIVTLGDTSANPSDPTDTVWKELFKITEHLK